MSKGAKSQAGSNYEALDLAIVKSIGQGRSVLYNREVSDAASPIAKAEGREEFRVIDGRLTALKKKGCVKFERGSAGGWRVVEARQ